MPRTTATPLTLSPAPADSLQPQAAGDLERLLGRDAAADPTTRDVQLAIPDLAHQLPAFHVPPKGAPTAIEYWTRWSDTVEPANGLKLKANHRRTLRHIAGYSDLKNGRNSHPSMKTLADATGYSVATIERHIAHLVACGLITVSKRKGKRGNYNVYSLVLNPSKRGITQERDVTNTDSVSEVHSSECSHVTTQDVDSSDVSLSGYAPQNEGFKNRTEPTITELYAFNSLVRKDKPGFEKYDDPNVRAACLKRSRKHGWGDAMAVEIAIRIQREPDVTSPAGLWETVGLNIPAGFDDSPIPPELVEHHANALERYADFQAERAVLLAEEPEARERRAALLDTDDGDALAEQQEGADEEPAAPATASPPDLDTAPRFVQSHNAPLAPTGPLSLAEIRPILAGCTGCEPGKARCPEHEWVDQRGARERRDALADDPAVLDTGPDLEDLETPATASAEPDADTEPATDTSAHAPAAEPHADTPDTLATASPPAVPLCQAGCGEPWATLERHTRMLQRVRVAKTDPPDLICHTCFEVAALARAAEGRS